MVNDLIEYFLNSSASYEANRDECRLSSEDRYTQPQAFEMNPIYDYIENQCTQGNELFFFTVDHSKGSINDSSIH